MFSQKARLSSPPTPLVHSSIQGRKRSAAQAERMTCNVATICSRPLQDSQNRIFGNPASCWRTKGSEGSEDDLVGQGAKG
jgi:hypothetical protein